MLTKWSLLKNECVGSDYMRSQYMRQPSEESSEGAYSSRVVENLQGS